MLISESSTLSDLANILTVTEKVNKIIAGNGWTLRDFANLATVIGVVIAIISVIVAMIGLYFVYQKLTKQMQIFIRQRKIDNLCIDAKEAYEAVRKVELAIVEAVPLLKVEPGITKEKQREDAIINVVSCLYELKHKLSLLKEIPDIIPQLDSIKKIIKAFVNGKFLDGGKFPAGFRLINGLQEIDSNWSNNGEKSFEEIEKIKKILLDIRLIQQD